MKRKVVFIMLCFTTMFVSLMQNNVVFAEDEEVIAGTERLDLYSDEEIYVELEDGYCIFTVTYEPVILPKWSGNWGTGSFNTTVSATYSSSSGTVMMSARFSGNITDSYAKITGISNGLFSSDGSLSSLSYLGFPSVTYTVSTPASSYMKAIYYNAYGTYELRLYLEVWIGGSISVYIV